MQATPPRSYAQFGDDLEVSAFFGPGFKGFFLDVGANNGIRDSNSYLLEQQGWRGVLIEANPSLVTEARANRPLAQVLNVAAFSTTNPDGLPFHRVSKAGSNLDGLSGLDLDAHTRARILEAGGVIEEVKVPTSTLNDVLQSYVAAGQVIDFVSLDIEGAEFDALQGFDLLAYRPRLILIEDNSRGGDQRVPSYLRGRGYFRVHRTGWNDWYVSKNDAHGFLLRSVILRLRLVKWTLQRIFKAR